MGLMNLHIIEKSKFPKSQIKKSIFMCQKTKNRNIFYVKKT